MERTNRHKGSTLSILTWAKPCVVSLETPVLTQPSPAKTAAVKRSVLASFKAVLCLKGSWLFAVVRIYECSNYHRSPGASGSDSGMRLQTKSAWTESASSGWARSCGSGRSSNESDSFIASNGAGRGCSGIWLECLRSAFLPSSSRQPGGDQRIDLALSEGIIDLIQPKHLEIPQEMVKKPRSL